MSSIATIFGRQLAASCSRAAVRPAARLVSTTAVSRDAQRKPDSAGESVKRGAANVSPASTMTSCCSGVLANVPPLPLAPANDFEWMHPPTTRRLPR